MSTYLIGGCATFAGVCAFCLSLVQISEILSGLWTSTKFQPMYLIKTPLTMFSGYALIGIGDHFAHASSYPVAIIAIILVLCILYKKQSTNIN